LILLALSSALFLNKFLQYPSVQHYILSHLSEKYEIHTSGLEISIQNGLGINVYDLVIASMEESQEVEVSRLTMILDISQLIQGNIVFSHFVLFQPQIKLSTKKSNFFKDTLEFKNFGNMIIHVLKRFRYASLQEGHVIIADHPFQFYDLNCDVSHIEDDTHNGHLEVKGKGGIRSQKENGTFTFQGILREDSQQQGQPFINITLKTGTIPLLWVAYITSQPVEGGYAEAEIQVKGSLMGPVSVKGKIITKELRFMVVDKDMTKDYYFLSHLNIDLDSHYYQKVITISLLQVRAPDFSLTAQCKVDFNDSVSPYLSLNIKSPFMPLRSFKNIFPTPLLPPWVEYRLFPVLTEGDVRLVNFSLKGTFNEIEKLDLPENKEVLDMEIEWKNVTTLKDRKGIPFEGISGSLKIKKGDLFLSPLKGHFGLSVIDNASLTINSLYMEAPLYRFAIQGHFALSDLKEQETLKLIPESVRRQLHEFQALSGNLEAYLKFDYKETRGYPEIQEGKLRLKNCSIIHNKLFLPLLFDNAEITIDEKTSHFTGKGELGKSRFFLSGSSEHSWQNNNIVVTARAELISNPDTSLHIQSKIDFNNREDPYLSLKIKTSFLPLNSIARILPNSLFTNWVGKHILPALTGGTVRLIDFSLNGTLNEIKNLGIEENKDVLSMKMEWKNVDVLRNRGVFPFKIIYGSMKIENGTLLVSKLKTYFGISFISDASLSINNLYARDPLYSFSIKGNFDLNDLKKHIRHDFFLQNIQDQLQNFQSLDGALETNVQFDYKRAWKYPEIHNGEFIFKNCLVVHKDLFLPLLINNAHILIDDDEKSEFKGKGAWGESEFKFSGSAENLLQIVEANVKGRVDVNDLIRQFHKGKQLPIQFSHYIPSQFTFSFSKINGHLLFDGEIDLKEAAIDTKYFSMNPLQSINKFTFNIEIYQEEKVAFNQFQWSIGKSIIDISSSYKIHKSSTVDLKVSTKRLMLEDLRIQSKETEELVKGTILGQVEISIPLDDLSRTTVMGNIETQNISINISALPLPIRDCHLELSFIRNRAYITFLKFRLGYSPVQSPVEVHGYLEGWDGLKGKLTVSADYLDISYLVTYKKDDLSLKSDASHSSRFIERTNVQLDIEVIKGHWKKLEYGPLQAQCSFRSGNFYIEQSMIQMGQSFLNLKGHIKTGVEPQMLFSIYIKLIKHPMREILQSFDFEKYLEVVEVDVNTEGYIYMKGVNRKELISSLTGAINLHMEKGVIRNSYVIVKVLKFISLRNIIKKKTHKTNLKGFYFKNIKGYITVNGGVLETDNLIMKAPLFDVVARGKVDLNKERIDSVLEVHPLKTISSIISKIPIIGYILTGKEKALFVYSFKVEGSLFKPEVEYQPWQNIKDIARWYYKRSINTPERLFKKISEIKNNLINKKIPLPDEN
jgi:hypothetical protein